MLSTKPCMQCLLVFGMVSSLHPTSLSLLLIICMFMAPLIIKVVLVCEDISECIITDSGTLDIIIRWQCCQIRISAAQNKHSHRVTGIS